MSTTAQRQPAWLRILEIILGIIILPLAVYILIYPGVAIATLSFLVAIGLFILGLTRIVGAFAPRVSGGMRILSLIVGIIALILSVYALAYPITSAVILAWIVGFGLIIIGFEALATGGTSAEGAGRGAGAGLGVLAIILGFVVIFLPGISLVTIAYLIGIAFFILGIEIIVSGFLGRWVAGRPTRR